MSDSCPTDQLLTLAAKGDREAFEALFLEHRVFLRNVIDRRLDARVRARVDASDIVQEAQLAAFQQLSDYLERRPMSFRLWLIKTALQHLQKAHRFHLATQARSADREVSLPEQSSIMLADRLMDGSSSPSNKAQRNEVSRQIREVLRSMPPADQEIILFRLFEGLSNAEVACLLLLTPEAAKKRYARALQRIRQELVARGTKLVDGVSS
jgi:RNA polymerase sigma-70 factor (ECF subfamily)